MAMAMLTIAVMIVAGIINTALKSTSVSKNYLIAQNLATESIEALKSIRDTNWLRDPENKNCWLRLDYKNGPCLLVATKGKSYISLNPDGYWKMVDANVNLNIANGFGINEAFRLYRQEKKIGDQTFEIYVHDKNFIKTPSLFYRSIYFRQIAPDQSMAIVEVKVQWREGSKVYEIARDVTLFNYQ